MPLQRGDGACREANAGRCLKSGIDLSSRYQRPHSRQQACQCRANGVPKPCHGRCSWGAQPHRLSPGCSARMRSIQSRPVQAKKQMAVFVLIHGAWNGGWCWKRVAPLARAVGHDVYTPTLTGLGERVHLATPEVGLDTHTQDIVNLLEFEDLDRVVLVGHSFGGMTITT